MKFHRLVFEEEQLKSQNPRRGDPRAARVAIVERPWLVRYPVELHQTPRRRVPAEEHEPHRLAFGIRVQQAVGIAATKRPQNRCSNEDPHLGRANVGFVAVITTPHISPTD